MKIYDCTVTMGSKQSMQLKNLITLAHLYQCSNPKLQSGYKKLVRQRKEKEYN